MSGGRKDQPVPDERALFHCTNEAEYWLHQ